MGRLTPGQRLCPMGHRASHSLASSQQERVDSVVLGKTWSAQECSTEIHSGSQTTHSRVFMLPGATGGCQHEGSSGNGE